MYPREATNPIDEDQIFAGRLESTNEGYAIAKSFAAKYTFFLQRANPDLKYKTFVPCNLFGRYDNFNLETSHMIPAAIHKMHLAKVAGASSVEIWGDGTARREFMDAYDLADFVFHAIDRYDEVPHTINVGLGKDLSVLEYFQIIAKVVGFKGNFTFNLSRPVGVHKKVLSMTKALDLGWQAKLNLETSILHSYEYYLATNGGKKSE
jgi:GDP-L-fucose synthase